MYTYYVTEEKRRDSFCEKQNIGVLNDLVNWM